MEKRITLKTLAEGYLLSHRPPFCTAGTGEFYRNILSGLLWYAKREGWPDDPSLITQAEISSFLNYVATEKRRWGGHSSAACHPASPATCHHYVRVVKSLFSWAEDEGFIEESLMARLKPPGARYREVPPYSEAEVAAMLECCEDEFRLRDRFFGARNHAIISIFADTGIRRSEQAGLTIRDIDPKLERLRIRGKGAKMRTVPLANEARRSLRRYLKYRGDNGYEELWLTDDGQPLEQRGLVEMVVKLKKKAGVDGGGRTHRFRHYFTTSMLNAGAPVQHVQAILGHEGPQMTLKYAHALEIEKAIAAHRHFSPLDRLQRRRKVWWGDEDDRF